MEVGGCKKGAQIRTDKMSIRTEYLDKTNRTQSKPNQASLLNSRRLNIWNAYGEP